MYLETTSFLVLGISKSGIAAAEFLLDSGAECYICDEQKNDDIMISISALKDRGARVVDARDAESFVGTVDVLVLSPGVPIDNKISLAAKKAGKRIIGEMELGYLYSVSPIVAVTGTNGKTTTCSLISAVLDKAGRSNAVVGNIGIPFTSMIDRMSKKTVAVAEVSSFQLETVSTFNPHVAVVTNVSEDHLSRHYNMQNYIYLKSKLLFNQKESEFAVLNYDDYVVRGFSDKTKAKVVYFSAKEKVDGVYVQDELIYYKDVAIMDKRLIRIKGEHNLYNILAAVAVGKILNLPDNAIAEAVIEFNGIKHRIEYLKTVKGVDYINDSKATNPDSTVKALASMTKPTVLLLGGKDKGQSFDSLFEECGRRGVEKVVLFGEARYRLLKAAERACARNICVASNLFSAVALAYAEAQSGWCVLLSPACSSFDEFSGYEERGARFEEYVNLLCEADK